jgi:hypothetical protein
MSGNVLDTPLWADTSQSVTKGNVLNTPPSGGIIETPTMGNVDDVDYHGDIY